jgi:hypothetical protein
VIVEQHAVARFAWLREKSGNDIRFSESLASKLITITYNLVWWVPVVLGFAKVIDYRTGILTFFVITVVRDLANLYRVNVLTLEQAERFPLRAP